MDAWSYYEDPDATQIIDESISTRPRTPETSAVWDDLVQSVFRPVLKSAGYKKKALVWHRPSAEVWPVVQLARHHSDGDFIEFWVD